MGMWLQQLRKVTSHCSYVSLKLLPCTEVIIEGQSAHELLQNPCRKERECIRGSRELCTGDKALGLHTAGGGTCLASEYQNVLSRETPGYKKGEARHTPYESLTNGHNCTPQSMGQK